MTKKLFPEGIVDLNGNDTFLPKEDIMSEWAAIPETNGDNTSLLGFTYELNTHLNLFEQWVLFKT